MSRAAKSQMELEWESFEHLFRGDLERLEHRLQFMYGQMATLGVPRKQRETFVLGKLVELIQDVTEQSELTYKSGPMFRKPQLERRTTA